jgi:6-phosphogluconolactonase
MGKIDIFICDWRKAKPPTINTRETKEKLLENLAGAFLKLASDTQQSQDFFSVILGGGRTPRELNKNIVKSSAAKKIDWKRVIVFFSDERCVPPDHKDSNFKLIFDTLIEPLQISRDNVYSIVGELKPGDAAADYREKLAGFAGDEPVPVFDLALLGFGADGHTASLFPGSKVLKESHYLAVSAGRGPEGLDRVTVTFPVFNAAKNIWLLAAGAEKSQAFRTLVQGSYDPLKLPALGICPRTGDLVYWIDEDISSGLQIKR